MLSVNKSSLRITYREVFKTWLIFSKPFHNLTNQDMDILSSFLYKRYELSKTILDEEVLDDYLMSTKVRAQIMESDDIPVERFNNILSKFRKVGVIKDGRINKVYVPNVDKNTTKFQIVNEFELYEGT